MAEDRGTQEAHGTIEIWNKFLSSEQAPGMVGSMARCRRIGGFEAILRLASWSKNKHLARLLARKKFKKCAKF